MIRLFRIHIPARLLLLVVIEGGLISCALLAAVIAPDGIGARWELARHAILKISVASLVCLLCMHYYDLYSSFPTHNPGGFLPRLVQVLGTVSLVLSGLYYAWPAIRLGPGPFLLWILLVGLLVGGWRIVFCALNRSERLRQRALLVGEGPLLEVLASEVSGRPELGIMLIGYLGGAPSDKASSTVAHLGALSEVTSLVGRERITRILVTRDDRRQKLPIYELLNLKTLGVRVQDAADFYEAVTGKIRLESLRPSQLLFSQGFHITTRLLFYKRAASLLVSVIALILTAPIMAFAAVCVWLDSPGPVLFRQQRIGRGGRPFTLYKFRSMRVDPEGESLPVAARKNDARITRVGYWLRRLHIDELPQFFNILRGDMYLVGPRPFTPNMETDYVNRIPFYSQRWVLKPGITGWAQINHGYCESLKDNIEKLSYDLFYIRNLSVALDMLIVFQTIKTLVLGRGGR